MNRTNIRIPAGGMYQEWMSLIDLVEEDTAKKLNEIAAKDGWRKVQPKEALNMGFEEFPIDIEDDGEIYYTPVSNPSVTLNVA